MTERQQTKTQEVDGFDPNGSIFLPSDQRRRTEDLILALTLKRDPFSWVDTPEQQFVIYDQLCHARDSQMGNEAVSMAIGEIS